MEQNRPPQFKARLLKALYAMVLTIACITCTVIMFLSGGIWLLPGFIALILCMLFGCLAYRLLTQPYILFSEEGITIRRGVLFLPRQLNFTSIEKIERIEPDHFIHISMKSGEDVEFSLSTLRKDDRIRFIFLIESDVNRLKINQQP